MFPDVLLQEALPAFLSVSLHKHLRNFMRVIINRLPKSDLHMRAEKYPYAGLHTGYAPACNPGYAILAVKQMGLLQDAETRKCTV